MGKRAGIIHWRLSRRRRSGFTLLEMSIVLTIIAVVTAAGMTVFAASLQKRQVVETQEKLKTIQRALLNFRLANGRIPCPADVTLLLTDPNFGVEGATPGTCTGGTPAANFANGNDIEGMVPTTTLHLPDDDAIDGWGHRIMYAVDNRFTGSNAFTTYTISTAGGLSITFGIPASPSAAAVYTLISFGPDGHGAYPRNGAAIGSRISSGSTNTYELTNCDCNSSAVSNATIPAGAFVQKEPTLDTTSPTDSFDDIVVYATRYELASPTE